MTTKGLRVCREMAVDLRNKIADELKIDGSVSSETVRIYRASARIDSDFHQNTDPEFNLGGGAGVERPS